MTATGRLPRPRDARQFFQHCQQFGFFVGSRAPPLDPPARGVLYLNFKIKRQVMPEALLDGKLFDPAHPIRRNGSGRMKQRHRENRVDVVFKPEFTNRCGVVVGLKIPQLGHFRLRHEDFALGERLNFLDVQMRPR